MVDTASILVVDDDPQVRSLLSDYLGSHGLQVHLAANGSQARQVLASHPVNVVLLDLVMPGEDGLSVARDLRANHAVGIIMVTASSDVVDRIVGLEVGADDYVSKPFDPRELLARIKSVLRRMQAGPAQTDQTRRIRFGPFLLDLDARRLIGPDGTTVPLTSAEFALLEMFATRPNRVLSRDQILNLTQNRDWDPFDRSVDIRVARVRRKVEADPERPCLIQTVRGAGYMYVPAAVGDTATPP